MTCKELTVGPDWRVQFEKAFYSVAHRLIGTRVLAMGNSHTVRIFLDYQEITSHQRASRLWEIKRKSEHARPELEQYLNLTSEGLARPRHDRPTTHRSLRAALRVGKPPSSACTASLLPVARSLGPRRFPQSLATTALPEKPRASCRRNTPGIP